MKILKANLLLALLLFFGMSNAIYGQVQNKNSFVLRTSLHNFFDGSPMYQKKAPRWQDVFSNSYGIEFTRNITNKHFWGISVSTFYITNYTDFKVKERGANLFRSFVNTEGKYSNLFLNKNKHHLFWETGLSIRIGSETIFLSQYQHETFGEIIIETKVLFDLGILGGLKYKYYLGNHFNFNTGLTATVYPYTYDKKEPILIGDFDKAPNWKMIFLSVGIGFDYGK